MFRQFCKSKIHRAVVTQADVNYEGSITIDSELMELADLKPFERVQVASVSSGQRLETYVIEGARGSRVIGMNGAAANLVKKDEVIHIISYAFYGDDAPGNHQPVVIHLDQDNNPIS